MPIVFEVTLTPIPDPEVDDLDGPPTAEEVALAVGEGLRDMGIEWWELFTITATQKGES